MYKVLRPDTADERSIVRDAFPLADELIHDDRTIVIHQADPCERRLRAVGANTDHLAVECEILARSARLVLTDAEK